MRCSIFTEEQIIAILREQQAGSKTSVVCRKHGVSSATFYKWKATYSTMTLTSLEHDLSQLKRLGSFLSDP